MRAHLLNMFKYVFVGGTAALVDWAIFWVFAIELNWNYLLVGAVGFITAAGVNYWLCISFLYESGARFSQRSEIIGIYLISGVGLVFHELVLFLSVQNLDIHLMWCKILATGVVFFWNFALRNFYLFASPSITHD
ncbi:MAG: GtrA family protein [Pseudomonadota bacterium]